MEDTENTIKLEPNIVPSVARHSFDNAVSNTSEHTSSNICTIVSPNAKPAARQTKSVSNSANELPNTNVSTITCSSTTNVMRVSSCDDVAKGNVTFSLKQEDTSLPVTNNNGEKSYIVTKIVHKKTDEAKELNMHLLMESFLRYCPCHDSPLSGFAAREIFKSDVMVLHLKEVETDEEEPKYVMFGNNKNLKLAPSIEDRDGDDKVNCACEDCNYQDECDEYIYGPYCVAAVKRYFSENKCHSSVRCAYQVYVAHYNRVLDFHSFNWHNDSAGMQQTEITKPSYCMKEGSLKYALFWIKWQIENGPEKAWYEQERERTKRLKMAKMAKKAGKFKYRYTGNEGR